MTVEDQGDVPHGTVVGEAVMVDVGLPEKVRMSYTFYRGEHTDYLPVRELTRAPDGLARYVLRGWMPDAPFIGPDTKIVAFGSCFAANISRHLNNLGFAVTTQRDDQAYVSVMGDGIVNVHAVLQQFEWAFEGRTPEVPLWHGYKGEEFGYVESVRQRTRELFDAAEVFIITLGLSEVWYDEPTGEVFWRAVPHDKFDPTRHKFRVLSMAETKACIERIHAVIRRHRPEAAIVFTLSPITLSATFRPVSCSTASSASKAVLRAALDEVYREAKPADPALYYFPAYEIVTHCFDRPFATDQRHPQVYVLATVMTAFERYFCLTGKTDEDVAREYGEAQTVDGAVANGMTVDLEALFAAHLARLTAGRPAGLVPDSQLDAQMASRRAAAEGRREERVAARAAKAAAARAERVASRAERRRPRAGGDPAA